MNSSNSPDAVRELAYRLWMDRGCVGGSPEEDWRRAEEILSNERRADAHDHALGKVQEKTVDRAVEESFPASDPPAVHLKDEPPVNAGDKWEAAKSAPRNDKRKGATI